MSYLNLSLVAEQSPFDSELGRYFRQIAAAVVPVNIADDCARAAAQRRDLDNPTSASS